MISTGSRYLDSFFKYEGLNIVYGEAATGKTTLAVIAALEQARKEKKVVFVDAENSLSIERIKQLAPDHDKFIDNLIIFSPKNYYQQVKVVKKISELKDISLIVIDTIGVHFRMEVKKDPKKLQQLLDWQIRTLRKISKQLPIILTNQVYQDLKTGKLHMTAEKILKPWADSIFFLQKEPRKIFRERPEEKQIPFKILQSGVGF